MTAPTQIPFAGISNPVNFRNRIINGDMEIDQRNAGASVTIGTGALYTVDRWFAQGSVTSKFTAQQSSTAPTGFINSLLFTSSAATTPSSSDYYYFAQSIEGLNCTDLAWGTANAKTVTLSFWVRSSLTGTFSGAVLNSAVNRSYAFTFTINSANTFEYKTVTIAGDTSGTWLTTNGVGLSVRFALGAGSSFLKSADSWGTGNVVGATGTTQLISTNGATFYITGVQLEAGEQASGFEFMPIDVNLGRCLRYYQTDSYVIWSGNVTSGGVYYMYKSFSPEMRATPTMTYNGGGAGFFPTTAGATNEVTSKHVSFYKTANGTGAGYFIDNIIASAEL